MPFFVFIILGEYYEEYIKQFGQIKKIYTVFLKKIKTPKNRGVVNIYKIRLF